MREMKNERDWGLGEFSGYEQVQTQGERNKKEPTILNENIFVCLVFFLTHVLTPHSVKYKEDENNVKREG